MISSVPIHHNSFATDLMWRTHFPVKQESLDDSASNISPEIYADTENELDQQKTRPDHLAGFIPPTISSSPTVPSQQGIYLSPTYQQRDLSCHFRASPSRISPYPMRSSPNIPDSKTSPTFHSPNSILSSPSPSGFYHQKISPSGCDVYRASTPDKTRASPGTNSDLYRTSPNISADFHRGSPTSHISGASSSFGSDLFQSPHSYPHLPQSAISRGITPNDIYRSLSFNVPKTSNDAHTLSPRSNLGISDDPINMNSMQVDLSQRLSPQQQSPSYPGDSRASPISNDPQRVSPHQVPSERKLSPQSMFNQESHDSNDSRSPSPPVQNLKMMLQKSSSQEFWTASTGNPESPVPGIEAATDVPSNSLKCYFCSYNTKSRIQLNKHMRDAHTESKMMPNENETDEDNENETHSNLSEDFMMDEYDDEDGECDEFAVNINKVSQNANSNKRTNYKCKKCSLTFKNKDEYYVHQRDNHIKREKLLECKLCPFVTEYKHHHEYHIKNHFKMKPFKCSYSNCKYSCNNQSMLNSHVKSHKSFYQFHCKNCNYATKYMHSFKLHLRKNNHEKGITLNEDGSVNNDIIIDIHGTRRGPKRKSRKLDENTLQNINNNNCITQTIKKTIHQEPETEYNNNVTMSSNNGSSRSNSPLSSVNYNNNNNDSYYLNTKMFVYSHMASMINEKTPEIWVKDTNTLVDNFKQLSNVHDEDIPEVVDLSESAEEPTEMQVDTEAPLDLSKSVDIKPQHYAMDLVRTGASNTVETIQNQEANNVGVFNGNQKLVDPCQTLIKIENRVKTSADMIRIVGKNNYDLEHGNVFKNKNKIKLCKNNEKSIKNAFEKMSKTGNARSSSSSESVTILEPNVEIIDQTNEIIIEDTKTKNCDKTENKKSEKDNDVTIDITTNGAVSENPKKSPVEALSEANKRAISTNKNRRRKGKAYKLQINNDYVEENINDELKDEEVPINVVVNSPTVDYAAKTILEVAGQDQTTLPSSYEIQMDYLKQIQNQYLKTFQQNKCLDNCAVPLLPRNNNINNNLNSSQLFDAKSQILSNYSQQSGLDLVGSHLKNLERINSHLLQSSLNIPSRKKSEGLKQIDNIFHNKTEDQHNIFNPYLAKRNEASLSLNNNNRLWYKCELCDIQYLDELIYSIHMRYHNVDHPYKCNLCGLQTNNKFQFNLHIIQTPH
uniref:Protein hunchback n=1 Tax=Cacopsylla melanoneura TaxID=428564 RepID=A0A8D9FBD8_9HEMI